MANKEDKKAQATEQVDLSLEGTVGQNPDNKPAEAKPAEAKPENKKPSKAPEAVERTLYPEGTFHIFEAGRDKLVFPSGDIFIVPDGLKAEKDGDGRFYLV